MAENNNNSGIQLVDANALGAVLVKIKGSQDVQDEWLGSLSDSQPTGLSVEELAELWNNI